MIKQITLKMTISLYCIVNFVQELPLLIISLNLNYNLYDYHIIFYFHF